MNDTDDTRNENSSQLSSKKQFARLIAEIDAKGGFDTELLIQVSEAMGLSSLELANLIEQAKIDWAVENSGLAEKEDNDTDTFFVDVKEIHDATVQVTVPKGSSRELILTVANSELEAGNIIATEYNRTLEIDEWTIRDSDGGYVD